MLLFLPLLFMLYGYIMRHSPKSHFKNAGLDRSPPPPTQTHKHTPPPRPPDHDAEMLVHHRRSFLVTRRLKRWISRRGGVGCGGGLIEDTPPVATADGDEIFIMWDTDKVILPVSRAHSAAESDSWRCWCRVPGFLCASKRLSSVGLDIVPNTLSHILPMKIGGGRRWDGKGREGKGRKKEVEVQGQETSFPKREWMRGKDKGLQKKKTEA